MKTKQKGGRGGRLRFAHTLWPFPFRSLHVASTPPFWLGGGSVTRLFGAFLFLLHRRIPFGWITHEELEENGGGERVIERVEGKDSWGMSCLVVSSPCLHFYFIFLGSLLRHCFCRFNIYTVLRSLSSALHLFLLCAFLHCGIPILMFLICSLHF